MALIRDEILDEITRFKNKRKKKKIKNFEWKIKMINANIPKEFWKHELDNLKGIDKTAVGFVTNYCSKLRLMKKKGIGFLFMGGNGTGKTTLQTIILKEAIRKKYSAFYITMADIFRYIYMGFDNKGILKELDSILKKTDFLAIGELGKDYHRKDSKLFAMSEFDNIFRFRRSRCLPTSMDTNFDTEELEDTYGSSLISLFYSRLKTVRVKGRDFRREVQSREVDRLLSDEGE